MSAAKHFLTDPTHTVLSALESLTRTNPSLLVDLANKIIYRNPSSIADPTNVSVVGGGGSGHEPGFAGFVGEGLLTACVAGTIFASPGAEQVRTCLQHRLPHESKGVLVIVLNYTGDVLNFGMGVEKARAMGENIEMVVVYVFSQSLFPFHTVFGVTRHVSTASAPGTTLENVSRLTTNLYKVMLTPNRRTGGMMSG